MQLQHWVTASQKLIERGLRLFVPKSQESSEYKAWREKFLRKRLALCFWLSLPCLLTYTTHDLFDSKFIWDSWIQEDIAQIFFTIIWAFLFIKLRKYYSEWIMLGFSWSITVFPSIIMIYKGLPAPSDTALNMVFITQTALMPVYWKIHLTSQVGAIVSYFISLYLEEDTDWEPGSSIIYWFWMSFICTLAVYLYEQLQRKEFESRRELNVFLHSVSHDLRAPVMGTSMVLQNLLRKAQAKNNRVTVDSLVLEQLLQGSDRQLKMINSLLEAQNTSVQGIVLHLQPCCLDNLVREIILDLKPILDKNRIIVSNQISDSLPLIHADPTQLWRVLNNLITNALKHNPPGIELTLNAIVKVDTLRISVADNGIGIAPKHQERLFELYTRGDRAHYMPGLGIGLYLCQQIILAHGGEIGCDSYPNKGSTFWFTLPLEQSQNLKNYAKL
jgi:signal transduction histidine kinase